MWRRLVGWLLGMAYWLVAPTALADLPSLMPDQAITHPGLQQSERVEEQPKLGATLTEVALRRKGNLRFNFAGVDYQVGLRGIKTGMQLGDVTMRTQYRYSGKSEMAFELPQGWKFSLTNQDGDSRYQLQYSLNF